MAMPERRRSGSSFFIFERGIGCFVTSRKSPIRSAAKTARYRANSPDETGIFLTKMPRVPNIVIEAASKRRALVFFCIIVPLNLAMLKIKLEKSSQSLFDIPRINTADKIMTSPIAEYTVTVSCKKNIPVRVRVRGSIEDIAATTPAGR